MIESHVDPELLKEKQALITRLTSGAFVTAMAAFGIRMGLFEAFAGAGSLNSQQFAERTGLHERWLREWLRSMGASGLVEYDGNDRFHLSPEAATLLTNPSSTSFAGSRLASFPERMKVLDMLPEAFRTGIGYTWDDRGEDAVDMTENARKAWFKSELVPNALPHLDGVVDKLRVGARVADLGCGTGVALVEMAKAFPASTFDGYDISANSLARAASNAQAAGMRVRFHDSAIEPMPGEATFDLVTTFDVLHDMTHPERAATTVRRALKPDGTWFILEIDCAPTYEGNLERGREQAAMGYATSLMNCLASSMSEPGGAGLGTLGLPEPLLGELVRAAGFTRFRRLEMKTPHALYEVRV
jgi:2-polyprenyl-3-methyl-5-hydroxy-6-metoxy-1,4-benzoquinol methylase